MRDWEIEEFWARLAVLEENVAVAAGIPIQIQNLIRKLEKKPHPYFPSRAAFVRRYHDPTEVRHQLYNIRFHAEHRSLDEAMRMLRRLEERAQDVWDLAMQPYVQVAKGAIDGGKRRKANFSPATKSVMEEMNRLTGDRGRSVADAARIAAGKGLGASAGANRALWYRHKMPKKL